MIEEMARRMRSGEACPNVGAHVMEPIDRREWAQWLAGMLRTHISSQCPECGLWVIWVPKEDS